MKYTVYVIRNVENNKCYIGITTNFKRRQYEHTLELRKGIHHSSKLQKDYNYYGESCFVFKEIISGDWTLLESAEKEMSYIEKYDSCNNGYNMSYGGEGTPLTKKSDNFKLATRNRMLGNTYTLGIKHSDETKRKQSVAMKNCQDMKERKTRASNTLKKLWGTDSFREMMLKKNIGNTYSKGIRMSDKQKHDLSESQKGENNSFYGKKHSDETKKVLSDISKSRWKNPEYIKKVAEGVKRSMTTERKQKMSISSRGRSKKSTVEDALNIRLRYLSGEKPSSILKDYNKLSLSGINKICRGDSYSYLPNNITELNNMLINYQCNQK